MGQGKGFDAERLTRIDDWMKKCVDDGRFSGCSVLIGQSGKEAHYGATGLASIADNKPYERDTIVRIYSMTKMITTVALMMQVEKGLLHLDAPLSRFLPEFSNCKALAEGANGPDQLVNAPSPTIQQLLTHTSGMSYAFNPGLLGAIYMSEKLDTGPDVGGLEAFCKRAAKLPLAFQPGERWEYSIGVDVIGRVLEVITGRTLDRIFAEDIFEPLGMTDTAFHIADSKLDRFADCFTKMEDDPMKLTDKAEQSRYREGNVDTFSGGGGLLSTLDDYYRFGEMIRRNGAFHGGRLLSPNTLAFMRSNHLRDDIASMGPSSFAEMPMTGMGFGLGGAVVLDPALSRMPGSAGDYGWGGMASTFFWTDPVEDLNCIFFTQLIPSSSYPNRAELKALVHGALID